MKTRKGFGLLEIMISMVLIGIASVTIFNFLVYCKRIAVMPKSRLAAVNFARETMECLYQKSYESTDLAEKTVPESDALPDVGDYGWLHNRHGGERKYTITDRGDYKLITVAVTWNQ